ncbi:EF-hand domain-containing protein [Qipengyuania spongiae]|uniref:EF-hand domain-containing protein n=1 Tax=Qipengyuania spongiae TaxID=2909673 RepID=A0ABY5SWI6_9SPHN|nr:EF-hand domain-containing protein [Qipengyuania spongiae]UVI38903.1 EF-hand domain-containing protein [Qipengyuania spongiae]
MNRILLGAVLGLVLAGIGMFWWQGRAEVEQGAPPPDPSALAQDSENTDLPDADGAGLVGPAPPEATELTREQRRFFRYDRNRDWKISRTEMLSTRTNAFRKLDTDGNNLLSFEEWAVATASRFDAADANGNGELSPSEFASTKLKARAKPACRC